MKTGEKIRAKFIDWTSTEDIYNEGETGRGNCCMRETCNIAAETLPQLIEKLSGEFGINSDLENWALFVSDDETGAVRLDAQMLVDENNSEASPEQIKEWKRGKRKLWAAYIIFGIDIITEHPAVENDFEGVKIEKV
jgi:hypothetical protein